VIGSDVAIAEVEFAGVVGEGVEDDIPGLQLLRINVMRRRETRKKRGIDRSILN